MNERTRTFSWQDPHPSAQFALELDGLTFLQKMIAGEIPPPPIARLMNMQLVEVSEGYAVFVIEPSEYHYNPIGVVHGGMAATICDSALGCAVQTTVPAGMGYTTVELSVNYTRGITGQTGTLRCVGTVLHRGRRIATAEAKLLDERDKLYAHATTTCLILKP